MYFGNRDVVIRKLEETRSRGENVDMYFEIIETSIGSKELEKRDERDVWCGSRENMASLEKVAFESIKSMQQSGKNSLQ